MACNRTRPLQRWTTVLLAALLTAAGAALSAVVVPSEASASALLGKQCVREPVTRVVTCTYLVDVEEAGFRVPAMEGPLEITAVGGRGGGNSALRSFARRTIDVGSDFLTIHVGGDGGTYRAGDDGVEAVHAGGQYLGGSGGGYGGGGASEVFRRSGSVVERLVVAGGSGGAGAPGSSHRAAGGAGGAAGEPGRPGDPGTGVAGGGGGAGTPTAAGPGGTSTSCAGAPGDAGQGGRGGTCTPWTEGVLVGGGGGGGGWTGGGGGGAGPVRGSGLDAPTAGSGGGGGGTSYAPGGSIGTSQDEQASVVLRYTEPLLTSTELHFAAATTPAGIPLQVRLLGRSKSSVFDYTAFAYASDDNGRQMPVRIEPLTGGSSAGAGCLAGNVLPSYESILRCYATEPGTYRVTVWADEVKASGLLTVVPATRPFQIELVGEAAAGQGIELRATMAGADGQPPVELVGVTYRTSTPGAFCSSNGCWSARVGPLTVQSALGSTPGPDLLLDVRHGTAMRTSRVLVPPVVRLGDRFAVDVELVDQHGNAWIDVPEMLRSDGDNITCQGHLCWASAVGTGWVWVWPRSDPSNTEITVLRAPDVQVRQLRSPRSVPSSGEVRLTAHRSTDDPAGLLAVELRSDGPYDRCSATRLHTGEPAAEPYGTCELRGAGAHTISSRFDGRPGASTVVVVEPDPPCRISATAGQPQTAPAGATFPTPLTATVTDCSGRPVPGAAIVLTADALVSLPGGARSVTLRSGADGTVRTAVLAGATPGATSVVARSPLLATEARFPLSVGPPEADVAVALDLPAVLDHRGTTDVRLTVRNSGPSPSGAWTTELVLPHGLKAKDPGGGTLAGGVVRWTGASLPAGQQAVRVLVVRPRGKGPLVVRASAAGGVRDPDPADDTAVATARIG